MKLQPGFNIVEREYEPFENSMTIIEFLGNIYRNERISHRVTVRGLDTLLLNSYDQEEMIGFISNLLREGQSKGLLRPATTVQFIVSGKITKDVHTKIKIRDEYINLEKLFYGEILRQAPDWVHAVR
jgi:hypothetical protein